MDLSELFFKLLYIDNNVDRFIDIYGELLTEEERNEIKKEWALYTETYGKSIFDVIHNRKLAIKKKFKGKSFLWFLSKRNRMQVALYEEYIKCIAARELEKARKEGMDV